MNHGVIAPSPWSLVITKLTKSSEVSPEIEIEIEMEIEIEIEIYNYTVVTPTRMSRRLPAKAGMEL